MALAGVRVIELAGLAPSPFAGMILADFGASVIRVDRLQGWGAVTGDNLSRGKRSIGVNLKTSKGVNVFKKICLASDVLIEPYRPGVMEKMGLGPQILMKDNPRLIYTRMTGFGQTGPLKNLAGHDINYIGLSGVLSFFGRKGENPLPPANIIADFAGGGLIAALGIVMALLERTKSGQGQIIDANMVEGSAYVSSFLWAMRSIFHGERGTNLLDTGAPYYETYKTSDGKYMAVGALEPQFYAQMLKGLGLSESDLPSQFDDEEWPASKQTLANIFSKRTREEWTGIFAGTDSCVTPVLTGDEAPDHEHNKDSFLKSTDGYDGHMPVPAPRLSRTPAVVRSTKQTESGADTKEILLEMGFSEDDINELEMEEVIDAKIGNSKL